MAGKLIILSAPSGSGKTTIVKSLLQENSLRLEFSISACSRPKRENEIHGVDYYFLNVDDFKQKIKQNDFLEWEEVYENNFYGTLKSEIDRITQKENNVIFDVDVVGGLNIKKQYQNKAIAIFIMPPSIEELENRLKNRNTDTKETIQKRLAKASKELSFAQGFDYIIINDNLQKAIEETKTLIHQFIHS